MRLEFASAPRRVVLVIAAVWLTIGACSLVVDPGARQCAGDADCARFAGAKCDRRTGLCAAGGQPITTGSGGAGGGGGGAAGVGAGTCLWFDNKTRLTNVTPDGGLPPLPEETP